MSSSKKTSEDTLLDAIENIDPAFIEEASTPPARRPFRLRTLSAAAAVFVLGISALAYSQIGHFQPEEGKEQAAAESSSVSASLSSPSEYAKNPIEEDEAEPLSDAAAKETPSAKESVTKSESLIIESSIPALTLSGSDSLETFETVSNTVSLKPAWTIQPVTGADGKTASFYEESNTLIKRPPLVKAGDDYFFTFEFPDGILSKELSAVCILFDKEETRFALEPSDGIYHLTKKQMPCQIEVTVEFGEDISAGYIFRIQNE